MKFEARYTEENINVPERNYWREFLKLGVLFLVIITIAYLFLGFLAGQVAVHIPPGAEKALGRVFSRKIPSEKFPLTRAYAQKVLTRLIAVSREIPPFDYSVDIVDYPAANSVALPAGRIVLFRGLIEKLKGEEALAMILAHELGHYAYRDHLRGFGRGLVIAAIAAIFGVDEGALAITTPSIETIELKFSREDEQAADYFAIDMVFKVYGHIGKALDIYDILEEEDSTSRWALFSTHPGTKLRKDNLKAFITAKHYTQGQRVIFPGDGVLPFLQERKKEKTTDKNKNNKVLRPRYK